MKLKELYKKKVVPEMMKTFGYKNPNAVSKIEKVVVTSSFGKQASGKSSSERGKIINNTLDVLSAITGQKPSLTKAKKSVSSFKLREGQVIGAKVTLRRNRMNDFLEKLIWIVLPRTRDFRGIPLKSIDKQGNLTLGFKDYSPFPEVVLEKEKGIFGLEVTVVTSAKNKEEGIKLLRLIGFPLKMKDF
jgi:large subunit ribosomal protein L5